MSLRDRIPQEHLPELHNLCRPVVPMLRQWFTQGRVRYTDEQDLQMAIWNKLLRAGVEVEREFVLGPGERPDFFIPGEGLAIEVKVDGSPAVHVGQMVRYARHEVVRELLLIRPKPDKMPPAIGGKPLHVISFWASLL